MIYNIPTCLWVTSFNATECILPIIGSDHRKGSPMKVLISMVSKLEKLLEDILQSKVKLGTHQWNRALWSEQKNTKK